VLHIVDDVDGVQGVDGVDDVDGVALNFDWMPEWVLAVHSYDYPFIGTISVAFYERSYCIRQALLIMVTDNNWQWWPWPKLFRWWCCNRYKVRAGACVSDSRIRREGKGGGGKG
jgi:hypothetical protein